MQIHGKLRQNEVQVTINIVAEGICSVIAKEKKSNLMGRRMIEKGPSSLGVKGDPLAISPPTGVCHVFYFLKL